MEINEFSFNVCFNIKDFRTSSSRFGKIHVIFCKNKHKFHKYVSNKAVLMPNKVYNIYFIISGQNFRTLSFTSWFNSLEKNRINFDKRLIIILIKRSIKENY